MVFVSTNSPLDNLLFYRQLVSSYKGKFGYVHYYVKAQMERPHQPILECKKSFEVEEPLDVNTPDLLVRLLLLILFV